MSHKFICIILALLAVTVGGNVQGQDLSLVIDDQLVAGPGELTSVEYSPLDMQLKVVTVFEDIRCAPGNLQGPSGNSLLIIDQINEAVETDAEYTISLPGNGGSVDLDSAARVLRVTTSDDVGEQLDCERWRNSFWASDFENVFSVSALTPVSPFPSGNTLDIPFTVKNESLTTIATNVVVDFTSSAFGPSGSPSGDVDPPTFMPSSDITPLPGDDSRWTIDILWPGESRTINVAYQLDSLVPSGTLIRTEVFNVEARDRQGVDPITVGSAAPVVSEVTTGEALLEITKTQTAGPDPVTEAGQVLEYDIEIENTGTFSLTGVVVTDTFPNGTEEVLSSPIESLNPDGQLEPDETWTYTTSYAVEQDDIDAGFAGDLIVNTASVETVQIPGPTPAMAQTTVDVSRSQEVSYTTTAASANEAGQTLPYELEIENTGQVSITVDSVSATLPDNSTATLSGPNESIQPPNGKIDPGETWTYTTEYLVTQDDLDNKTNLTSVSSTSTSASTSSELRFAEVPVDKVTSVGLTKRITANATYDTVGDVIQYEFDVENTGTQTLAGPATIDDGLIGDESCPSLDGVGNGDSDLQPGEVVICTGSLTVDQGHLDTGSIENSATATVDGVTSDQSSVTATANQMPAITLIKSISSITVVNTTTVTTPTYANVGDVISYDFNVQNSGNQTLDGPVTVSDDRTTDEACPALTTIGDGDSDFDPGETVICTASYTVDQPDIDNGSVVNEATASADGTTSNLATATADADQNAELIVDASSSVDTGTNAILDAGDTINYSFVIENLGNTTLTNLMMTASKPDVMTSGTLSSLAPGDNDTGSFSASYVIKAADLIPPPGAPASFSVVFSVSTNEGASDNESANTPLP